MLEFENLPSVTKKQKRLSRIVSIIVSISVSVISGLLMAKVVWKRVKNRVKEVYATLIPRKRSSFYLMALNSQPLLLQKRSNCEMPLLAHLLVFAFFKIFLRRKLGELHYCSLYKVKHYTIFSNYL